MGEIIGYLILIIVMIGIGFSIYFGICYFILWLIGYASVNYAAAGAIVLMVLSGIVRKS